MAKKSWTNRPEGLPTRQCEGCGRFYHARHKECPNCGARNPTASGKRRVAKKKKRVIRRKKSGAAAGRTSGDVWAAALAFIEQAGGLPEARTALDTIDRIRQM